MGILTPTSLAPFPYHLLSAPPSLLATLRFTPSRPSSRPSFFSSLHCNRHLLPSRLTLLRHPPQAPIRSGSQAATSGISQSYRPKPFELIQSRERRVLSDLACDTCVEIDSCHRLRPLLPLTHATSTTPYATDLGYHHSKATHATCRRHHLKYLSSLHWVVGV